LKTCAAAGLPLSAFVMVHASAEMEHPIAVGTNLALLLTQNSVSWLALVAQLYPPDVPVTKQPKKSVSEHAG
jgi:hypothetical protein